MVEGGWGGGVGVTETSNNDPVSPADPPPFIPVAVSPLCKAPHVQLPPGALAGMSTRVRPCALALVRAWPSLEMRRDGTRLGFLLTHRRPLCSLLESSTSGRINYQLICYYLLSKGLGRRGAEVVWWGRSGEDAGGRRAPFVCPRV